jgi:hypothetical protein
MELFNDEALGELEEVSDILDATAHRLLGFAGRVCSARAGAVDSAVETGNLGPVARFATCDAARYKVNMSARCLAQLTEKLADGTVTAQFAVFVLRLPLFAPPGTAHIPFAIATRLVEQLNTALKRAREALESRPPDIDATMAAHFAKIASVRDRDAAIAAHLSKTTIEHFTQTLKVLDVATYTAQAVCVLRGVSIALASALVPGLLAQEATKLDRVRFLGHVGTRAEAGLQEQVFGARARATSAVARLLAGV